MNQEQAKRMASGKGFIAALDQSGGSTPKALLQYGVQKNQYSNEEEMYTLVHEMKLLRNWIEIMESLQVSRVPLRKVSLLSRRIKISTSGYRAPWSRSIEHL